MKLKFFTADTHFFHKDLLGNNAFAPRPFPSVEVMNQTIFDNWNERVKPTDTVYHLGDIALYFTHPASLSNEAVYNVLKALNGNLILIKGNHDSRAFFKYLKKRNFEVNGKPKFEFHDVGVVIKMNHRQLYMTHYPMMMGIVKQIINLHGHIHHYSVNVKENLNVGIDTPEKDYLNYKIPFGAPFSEADIEQMIKGKREDFAKRG